MYKNSGKIVIYHYSKMACRKLSAATKRYKLRSVVGLLFVEDQVAGKCENTCLTGQSSVSESVTTKESRCTC